MLAFVTKYWLEVFFGLVTGCLGYACKKFWKLYQEEKKRQESAAQEKFYKSMQELINKNNADCKQLNEGIQEEIHALKDELRVVKHGILNMQGKIFKNQCRDYLNETHKVTLAEYESLEEDHAVYNSLDGNHEGDALFNMVEEKIKRDLSE